MDNVKFLFEYDLHLWEEKYLSTINHKFNKKVYWWMVDLNHSIFDFYDKESLLIDVQNGAYVVVDHSQDPCSQLTLETLFLKELHHEFKNRNISKKQIIIITPTPRGLFLDNPDLPVKYVSFNSLFEITKVYAKQVLSFDFTVPLKSPKKHFLCLMRRDSPNRRLTNYLLHIKNIHHFGLVSHLRITEGNQLSRGLLKDEAITMFHHDSFDLKSFTKFGLMKHFLGSEYLIDKGTAAHSYPLHQKLSQDTVFEIVSETDTGKNLFLTEKTFKAILNKSPFIMLGNRFILKYLRHLGFKTFHPIINEEYDTLSNTYKRFSVALYEAEKLCNLSLDDCEDKLSTLNDICEFNYNHFLNTDWHFDVHKNISELIC
jgi:hypothetical protein